MFRLALLTFSSLPFSSLVQALEWTDEATSDGNGLNYKLAEVPWSTFEDCRAVSQLNTRARILTEIPQGSCSDFVENKLSEEDRKLFPFKGFVPFISITGFRSNPTNDEGPDPNIDELVRVFSARNFEVNYVGKIDGSDEEIVFAYPKDGGADAPETPAGNKSVDQVVYKSVRFWRTRQSTERDEAGINKWEKVGGTPNGGNNCGSVVPSAESKFGMSFLVEEFTKNRKNSLRDEVRREILMEKVDRISIDGIDETTTDTDGETGAFIADETKTVADIADETKTVADESKTKYIALTVLAVLLLVLLAVCVYFKRAAEGALFVGETALAGDSC